MTVFCFLWIPLFYLFRRSLYQENTTSGGVWALLLGSLFALIQFFFGNIITPGGFGLSRWISALVDIVALPALLPLLAYLIYLFIKFFHIFSDSANFANFALLWLIPGAFLRAVSWSSSSDPTLLVLVPVLWTAIVCGIPFFIDCIRAFPRWYIIILSLIGILILPFIAATSWWAFYSQRPNQGFLFLGFAVIPMLVSLIIGWIKSR